MFKTWQLEGFYLVKLLIVLAPWMMVEFCLVKLSILLAPWSENWKVVWEICLTCSSQLYCHHVNGNPFCTKKLQHALDFANSLHKETSCNWLGFHGIFEAHFCTLLVLVLFSAICLNKAQSQSMSMQYAVNVWRVCPHFMKLSVWVFMSTIQMLQWSQLSTGPIPIKHFVNNVVCRNNWSLDTIAPRSQSRTNWWWSTESHNMQQLIKLVWRLLHNSLFLEYKKKS